MTVLTAALQIYVFEMKGLASVPDEKEQRESILKGKLKDMLLEAIEDIIQRLWQPESSGSMSGSLGNTDVNRVSSQLDNDRTKSQQNSKEIFLSDSTDVIAIKLAI